MNRASIVSDNVQSFINQNTPSQDFTGAPSSFASFDVVQPAPIGTPPQVQLLKALGDFYTSDRDKDARKRAMDAFGSSLPSLSDPSTDAFVGRKVVSSAGYVGNPMAFLHDHAQKLGLQMPEGISSDMQAYSLIGNHIRSVALKDYEARLQQQKEVQQAQDKLMEMNGDQWAALINGDEIREKKFFATIGHLDATSQGKWVDTLGKARAAMNIISNWQKEGGMTSDAKSVLGKSFTGLKENMDKADYEQLARAESRRSLYELTAKQYAALFDSLSTTAEDGTKTLDEAALALFRFALSREMRDQQRISGDFWGSFTDGLRGLWNETEDFFRNPDTPLLMQGAVGLATQALQGMDETYIRSNPDYIKLRDIIYNAEDEGTDISKDATFLAQALAKSGNIVGESLPATLAGIGATIATGGLGAAAGLAAWAGAASTIAPSYINAAVRSNIAEGNSNPWLTGVVQGGAQAAAEGIFGIIPGGGKATQFLLRVGAKTPLAGRVLAKAQSNALARFFFSGTTESIGEISEDVIADFGSNLGLNLMREVGIDISAPNADALANLSETLEDPAQITAMVGYCFTLGLVGMGADSVKARTFARNYDNLKAAGFSRENAAYISQRAEEISNRIAEVQANPETSDSAKTTIIDALEKDFQQEQQNLFKKDVLDQDPSVLLKRAKENKKELMSQREAALLTASGARDAALAKMGVLQEPKPLANGKYLLTFQTQKPDGTPEETKVEWTDQQLTDWVQLQNDNIYAQAMRQYQSWLTGAALAQSPLAIKDAEQAKTQLLNLGVAPTAAFNDAFADLAKRGTIDAPFVQKLSNLANAEINAFMEAGMTREQAAQQPSAYIPGVAAGTLANLRQATRQRVAAAAQTTEGKTIGITQDNATFPAIRLNAIDGGSVVAFIAGDISPLQFSEDMWEAKLVNQVNSGKLTWTQLEDQLKKAEAELRRINPAISILPKKDSLSRQDIIEGYSTLQTADFITNHKHYPLSQNTHTLLDTVIRGSQAVRAAQLIGEAWKNVDKSDIDTSLSDLLRDAGMQMGAIFDSAKVDAQVRQAVWERRGVTESLEQRVQAVIDEYNAEQQEIRDNPPEPAGTPQPIPAEESVTGEAIPAEDPLARADNNPETGDFNIPSMPTQQDERGRGLKDNKYAETGNGSVIGMVDPNTVKPCPEVQQFKTIDTAAGRTEAREDGTVRDLTGKWNPLADPIFILRRKNGELQVISGRHRLAHAKKNGAKYIKAEVWDESEKFDIAWARRQDVAHNILQGTANATDIAVFFRGNPITYDEANALGFIQKKKNGEDAKASVMGITIALHASEEIYTRLVNGKVAESTAFQLASMFPDNERQQLEALDHYENGESWTSIAWYVNTSAEDFAAADGLTQGNLFGEGESAGRKKLADYVGMVEKRIRSIINLLKDAKRIKRNPALAGELGFNFSTETDIANARAQLEILLDAYQHPKQGEMEDVKRKAEEWDGKSPVEPTLSELIGEAKLLVPYSTAEASPAEDTKIMDDLFSSMALDAKELTFENREYSNAECIKALASDSETPFVNDETGIEARINRKQRDKITSGAAQRKSEASGFSSGVHNYVASNIRKLFKHATLIGEYADKNRRENIISIKRFACPIMVGNRGAFAYMTVKESKGKGNRIYTIELDEIKKLEGNLDEHLNEMYNPSSSSVIVSRLRELGKSYFGNSFENSSDDISSSAIATTNPDDIAAQYANARKGSLAHRMMHHARAEANRFRRVLRKPTTDAEAAQDLASVLIFMESAMRYVPSVHLPRMTAKRNALEAYIKMMQQGRIGVNRNGTIRRSGLTQEQINAVAEQAASAYEEAVARQDILPENKLTKEEAKKLQRDFIRAAARDNIGTTIASIYDDIASSIATALSDKLIDRIEKRIDSIKPRISNNRKPIQAKVAPRAFRDIAEINGFIHLSSKEYEDTLDSLIARAASTEERDQGDIAAIEHQIALLKTYGNLKGKSYAEVQAAYTDLMAYIATERHIWQDILEIRDSEMREDMQAFFDKVDAAAGDIYNLDKMRRKADSLTGWASSILKSMQSPAQLFLALSGHPALKKIAEETLNGISNAHVGLLHAESLRENMMLSAFARIIGIKPLGRDGQYSSRQLNHLKNNEFADFTQDLLKTKDTGITRTYLDRKGNEVSSKIVANDGQLLNIILMAEQDHYKPNAEKWGYTKETLDAIKSHLGSRKLAFAYALRSILQSDNLPAYFEERTGIVMPENKFYWPGHLSVARLATQESASLLDSSKQGGTYGMLRNRVANDYDFALADIQSVFQAACAQRNNYIHIQPITNKWRRMLHDDQFSKRLEGTIGSHNFMLLKGFLDALDGSGAADGFMAASINNKLAAFLSSYAKNVLAGNPTTLLKQTDAIMHGALMEGTNAAQISKQILLDRLGKGKMNYASIMELPALKNRYRGSSAYEDLIRSGANASWSKLGNFLRLGMNAIEKVDVVCNTISACALYNVTYERLKSENETAELPMTESEIQIACEQQVTNMLELTAQPLRKTQKSAFVILNNNLLADACTFLGSETLNKIGFAVARATKTFSETGSRAKALGSFMKVMSTMGVASALIGMAIQVLKGTSPGDDADKADWLLYVSQELAIGAAGIDMLSQLPLVGELFNVRYSFSKGWNMPLATECRETIKLVSMAIEDRDHSASEYFNKAHAITRGLATSSGIFAAMQGPLMRPLTVSAALLGSMTTVMNAISPFAKGIEKDAIWAAPLGLESKKQRQARERRRKAILRQLSRSRSTRSVPTRYNLAL